MYFLILLYYTYLRIPLGGADEIKEHPFFRCIDFEKLYRREIEAPWKPPMLSDDYIGKIFIH